MILSKITFVCHYVKGPTLGSAGGEIGRLVSFVAISGMPENTFFKCKVARLATHCSSSDRDGYMYFCKSKNGCASMWNDVFQTFIVPTSATSSAFHNHHYSNGSQMEPFLHTDGESIIMNEAFNHDVTEIGLIIAKVVHHTLVRLKILTVGICCAKNNVQKQYPRL
jgi:hypothetical protein